MAVIIEPAVYSFTFRRGDGQVIVSVVGTPGEALNALRRKYGGDWREVVRGAHERARKGVPWEERFSTVRLLMDIAATNGITLEIGSEDG